MLNNADIVESDEKTQTFAECGVPILTGWSEDPKTFEKFDPNLLLEGYGIDYAEPILAYVGHGETSEYLIRACDHTFYWQPKLSRLEHVTQPYTPGSIVWFMGTFHKKPSLQTLEKVSAHRTTKRGIKGDKYHDYVPAHLIPKDWTHNLRECQESFDCFDMRQYRLPVPVPILSSHQVNGRPKELLRCGERHHIYDQISDELWRIGERRALHDICRTLKEEGSRELLMTRMKLGPEFSRDYVVPGYDHPKGWSRDFDTKEVEDKWPTLTVGVPRPLLYGRIDKKTGYLVKYRESTYVWGPESPIMRRIDE